MISFKKKLFTSIGPLVVAFIILTGLLMLPIKVAKITDKTLKEASSSMGINVLRGNYLKKEAMKTGEYVPFFGSSELSRIDEFHPSVLAEKYQREYTPFLLGAAGTQSLSQYLMLQSMEDELKGKKAVFIISPQWFTKKGVSNAMFDLYYSPLQVNNWIQNLTEITENDRYLAQRLLEFKSVKSDTNLQTILQSIKESKMPTDLQLKASSRKVKRLSREDELFAKIGLLGKQEKIDKATHNLPNEYDFDTMDALAVKLGKEATSNNDFGLANGFYKTRVAPSLNTLKDSQADFSYVNSPEFADFQLVLNELSQLDMEVQFIIPPVNEKWSSYTGLSQEMLKSFAKKIEYQLNSQGFDNVLDLNQYADVPYFMADTIHLGWRGWLTIDQVVAPFLNDKNAAKINYNINNDFLTKTWCQKSPDELTNN